MGWFTDFIRKAFFVPEPQDTQRVNPTEEHKSLPFDLDTYIPRNASIEEQKIAHKNGYLNARDMKMQRMRSKIAGHAEREMHRRRELQTQLDMESVGVPMDDLRDMADDAIELPSARDRPPQEILASKDESVRRARIAGMTNRYIELNERLRSLGMSWDMNEDEVPQRMRDRFLGMHYERHEIERRMAAYGVDIGEIDEGIQDGREQRVERVDYEMMSNDPELRAVQEAYRKDAEEYEGKSSSGEQSDRLVIREDYRTYPGWKSLDDTGLSRVRPGSNEGEDDSFGQRTSRTPRIAPGPKGHIKAAEMELMKERLLELDELLDELGYARGTLRENVPPVDRDAFDRITAERDHIRVDMAGLCEDMDELEQQRDEDAVQEEPRIHPSQSPVPRTETIGERSKEDGGHAPDTEDDPMLDVAWGDEDGEAGTEGTELDWDAAGDIGVDGGGWE